jgi:hypothetical protein
MQPLVGSDPGNRGLAITAGPQTGIHLRDLPDTDAQLAAAVAKAKTRTFGFERGNGAWQVNGKFFDEDVINANPALEGKLVWTRQNGGGGWSHPIHVQFEEVRPLSHNVRKGSPMSRSPRMTDGPCASTMK